jgi:hypothetical protein
MADYFSPTVFQETIPDVDMTPLERLLLSHIFDVERDGGGWYFFSDQGPSDIMVIERQAIEAARVASQDDGNNTAAKLVREHMEALDPSTPVDSHLELDMSKTSWEWIVQDIIRRSPTLTYVSVVSSFTCSKMRSDGFGGAVVVISADEIFGKSTTDLLQEFVALVAP